jgi:large subunit ribosomal protein L15
MDTERCKNFRFNVEARADNEQIHHLNASGLELILAHTMYAVIGAIALQRGGEVAARVAREKILKPLGIS